MSLTVAQMTKSELKELIEEAVEQKLIELFGDPDEGLEIHESLRDRLLRQKKAVEAGDVGEPFGDVLQHLGLE
jgi:hypothetical protein